VIAPGYRERTVRAERRFFALARTLFRADKHAQINHYGAFIIDLATEGSRVRQPGMLAKI
jgi:hypothetical protein